MPIFTIEAPDGRKIKIEADTPDLALRGAQEYATQNPANPKREAGAIQESLSSGKERFSALTSEEQDKVARTERGGFDDTVRGLARGVPFIGTFGDEINARLNAATGGYLGGSQAKTYDERVADNLAYERAKDRTFDQDHPVASTALQIGGGVAGTIAAAPLVAGAGAVGVGGRLALGLGARTLPGAVARGAAAGAVQGAAAGAGDAEGGFVERGMGAIGGGAVGGAVGAGAPLLFEAGRRVVSKAFNNLVGQETPLAALSSGARRYVGEISDPASVARIEQDLARLGPNAMLADVSPEWQTVAGGAAARPGSRNIVVEALTTRDAGKNERLAADLNRSLGPAPVPSQVEAGLEAGRLGPDGLRREYGEAFQRAADVDTGHLAENLDEAINLARGKSQRALRDVRTWLNAPRAAGHAGQEATERLDTNPTVLFQIRQEIDAAIGEETNTRVIARLTEARQEVDNILADAVPGLKDVDARFQELSRQSEALRRGGQVLDGGKTAVRPQELAQEIQQGALPQGTLVGPSAAPHRLRQGVRAEIDRVAGTNANDPIALQRLVKGEGDWNRTKLRQVYGDERADEALGAIDREVQFRNTHNQVTAGSQTAPRQGFKEFLDRAENVGPGGSGSPDATMTGIAAVGIKRLASVLTGTFGRERAQRYATELAQAAVATGMGRDEFVAALRQAGVQQKYIASALHHATATGLVGSREIPKYLPTSEKGRAQKGR